MIKIKDIRPKLKDKIKTVNKIPILIVLIIILSCFVFVGINSFNSKNAKKTTPTNIGNQKEADTKINKIASIDILKLAPKESCANKIKLQEITDQIDTKTNNKKSFDTEKIKGCDFEQFDNNRSDPIKEYFDELEFSELKNKVEREQQAILSKTNVDIGHFEVDANVTNTGLIEEGITKFNSKSDSLKKDNNQRIFPQSKFELRLGTKIPATLETGINSQLPGMITARVTSNVYDSATGKYLLIPSGSQLVGTYQSDIDTGQSRIMAAWSRINFPDGSYLNLNQMTGGDLSGLSGFKDRVNNHYLKIFSHAALLSLITTGVSMSQDYEDKASSKFHESMSKSLGQNLGQVATDMIRRQMNIQPTINIRSGYKFVVMVSEDIIFNCSYETN